MFKPFSLTYWETQRKPGICSQYEKRLRVNGRHTFTITHSLHDRAHEDLNGSDVGKRDLALSEHNG